MSSPGLVVAVAVLFEVDEATDSALVDVNLSVIAGIEIGVLPVIGMHRNTTDFQLDVHACILEREDLLDESLEGISPVGTAGGGIRLRLPPIIVEEPRRRIFAVEDADD